MEASRVPQTARGPHVTRGVLARAAQIALMFVLIGFILFAAAGRLDWAWGWLYLAIYLVSTLVNAWFLRSSPELVAERGQPADVPTWDRVIGGLWALAQFVALPLVAGLDVRFGWTGSVDVAWHVAGAVIFAAGLGLFGWALTTNAWFSTVARVQPERGHAVCRDGPYRIVRHPGYSGGILQSLGSPLLLGSVWALVPATVAVALMVARTRLEDRMLTIGLAGYPAYARDVRYRIAPGIW